MRSTPRLLTCHEPPERDRIKLNANFVRGANGMLKAGKGTPIEEMFDEMKQILARKKSR